MELKLEDVRLSFPDLWEPKDFNGDGKYRFNATFLVEPNSANDRKVKAAIDKVGADAFGAKWPKLKSTMEGNSQKICYLDGDTKDYDGYEGHMYLASHRKDTDGAPKVVHRNPSIELKAGDGVVYGGCYVNAFVEIYAQTGQNPGIRAGFRAVQFSRDGDSFGGAKRASADGFDNLADQGEETAEDLF
jgi:hypothetical protein